VNADRTTSRKRWLHALLASRGTGTVGVDELLSTAWQHEKGSRAVAPPTRSFRVSFARTLRQQCPGWSTRGFTAAEIPLGVLAEVAAYRQPTVSVIEQLLHSQGLNVEFWIEERTNPKLATHISGREVNMVGACLKIAFWPTTPLGYARLSAQRIGQVVAMPLTRSFLILFTRCGSLVSDNLVPSVSISWTLIARPAINVSSKELSPFQTLTRSSRRRGSALRLWGFP
jgi:hypothetical protein